MSDLDLSGAKILLVDDNPTNLKVLWQALEEEAYEIMAATSGQQALDLAQSGAPDLILLDVMMPYMDGFETCRRLKANPQTAAIPVLFITARDETEALVEGFNAGGFDYIVKPFRSAEVLARTRTHLERTHLAKALAAKNGELQDKNAQLQEEIDHRRRLTSERDQLSARLDLADERESARWGVAGFVGKSAGMQQILDGIARLQHHDTLSVLITGESGTGKELIARGLHFSSPRKGGPFVPVNCSAVPGELSESLFFGHKKGAFTGADKDRSGYFELADGGTLFLDEIGDMPAALQAKLLRVLEDGEVMPVGAAKGKHVDVRVLAATNVDLQQGIADGRFRQDLYFRLARYTVESPPLRERREDIPTLAEHFLTLFAREMGYAAPQLSCEALMVLEDYAFPGNVRELKNIVERSLIESGGREIQPQHLHLLASAENGTPVNDDGELLTLVEQEKRHILRALELSNWVVEGKGGTAQLLDINAGTLRSRMKKYGIARPR